MREMRERERERERDYTHTHTHACTHSRTHTCTLARTHARTHTHTHTHTSMYARAHSMHERMHARMHEHTQAHTRTPTHIHTQDARTHEKNRTAKNELDRWPNEGREKRKENKTTTTKHKEKHTDETKRALPLSAKKNRQLTVMKSWVQGVKKKSQESEYSCHHWITNALYSVFSSAYLA